MSTTRRNQMAEVMNLAWQFVKRNGMSMSEALKTAWQNFKLKARMRVGIAKFYFRKIDGTIREAYGTLKETLTPMVKGVSRKQNESVQVYFDTEKQEWRSFKKANLLFN